jgi:hypothetical protein
MDAEEVGATSVATSVGGTAVVTGSAVGPHVTKNAVVIAARRTLNHRNRLCVAILSSS